MTNWRAASDSATAERRAAMLERARRYFSKQKVLAVDTPALGQYPATDPNIESLAVHANSGTRHFLHTSPEFCMKRLLADGYPDIYSICRVYRDGEAGRQHMPEFTMVEWYRLGFGLCAMIADTTRFIATCLDEPELANHVEQYDYCDAFEKFAGIDVFGASVDQLAYLCTGDERLKSEIGVDRSAWLDLMLSTIIAPQFARDKLTVVRHYPASQAALARLCPDDERLADRFEVFIGALELANGYVELNDAIEQQRRFDREIETRKRTGRSQYSSDQSLISALEAGLPDCAGVAVGVERLQMAFDKTDDIRDVIAFSSDAS
ncbi:MAG: EF-P lysine aminoacylase EpmA [Gammaproteobacteria bacterium]|nr:EF-P lysine aminoacylase EpmA [Gammaproteobacteria bacterium]